VRGDVIEIHPAYDETAVRIELFGDEIETISVVDPLTGERVRTERRVRDLPGHPLRRRPGAHAGPSPASRPSCRSSWLFEAEGKLLEAQRLRMRTQYDLEMIAGGRVLQRDRELLGAHRRPKLRASRREHLLDFFPDDFLVVIDESHVTVPQLHGQYEGDRSRKEQLIEHGFRLPSAADNRPCASRSHGAHRPDQSSCRPRPALRARALHQRGRADRAPHRPDRPRGDREAHQGPDRRPDRPDQRAGHRGDRVLVTTLTKKMAEDLTDYLLELGVRVRYLHSEVDTLQRIEILRDLRLGEFDVLVGINLLREGLDLPEVSLVAILDADKEGFLRSETSLIQMIGRAARNVDGQVIMYADVVTRRCNGPSRRPTGAVASRGLQRSSTASTRRRCGEPSPTSWSTSVPARLHPCPAVIGAGTPRRIIRTGPKGHQPADHHRFARPSQIGLPPLPDRQAHEQDQEQR
jgi:excinuclease ABC subunit B